jgi:hypothetical protein
MDFGNGGHQMKCGQCAIKEAELKAATEVIEAGSKYIAELEDAFCEMGRECAELFEAMLPEVDILMPSQAYQLKDAIAGLRKMITDHEKEKAEKNETHTKL